MCNAQTVVWLESEWLECRGKWVYHPGDLVVMHDTILMSGMNVKKCGRGLAELDRHGKQRYNVRLIGPSTAHGSVVVVKPDCLRPVRGPLNRQQIGRVPDKTDDTITFRYRLAE